MPTDASRTPFWETIVGPNEVSLLKDGGQAFPAMLEAIAAAKQTICFESYIILDDVTGLRFLKALMQRAREGVETLLSFDSLSTELATETRARLTAAGVKVLPFEPLGIFQIFRRLARRNHRKSMVVDGQVAFTGGLNISDDYAAREDGGRGWRDTHVRVRGPAAVELERLFLETWRRHGGPEFDERRFARPPVPSFDGVRFLSNEFFPGRRDVRRAYTRAITNARKSILLTHAYFVPPVRMLRLLLRAARRKVRVALIVAAATDIPFPLFATRGLYRRLLAAGIEVYEWHGNAEGPSRVLHAKTAVIDSSWSTIGSSNFDALSFRENLEVNAVFRDQSVAAGLEELFTEDLRQCTRVTVPSLGPIRQALANVALRLRRWL